MDVGLLGVALVIGVVVHLTAGPAGDADAAALRAPWRALHPAVHP